jgi:hypothetical protein
LLLATHNGLDSPDIELRCRRGIPCRPDGRRGPPSLFCNGGQSMKLTSHVLLEPSCKAVGPIPPQHPFASPRKSWGDIYLIPLLIINTPSPSKSFHTLRPFTAAVPALLSNFAAFCLLVVTPVNGTARPPTAGEHMMRSHCLRLHIIWSTTSQ